MGIVLGRKEERTRSRKEARKEGIPDSFSAVSKLITRWKAFNKIYQICIPLHLLKSCAPLRPQKFKNISSRMLVIFSRFSSFHRESCWNLTRLYRNFTYFMICVFSVFSFIFNVWQLYVFFLALDLKVFFCFDVISLSFSTTISTKFCNTENLKKIAKKLDRN